MAQAMKSNLLSVTKAQPLRDQVYKNLRQALLRGDFLPGERITEDKVTELLDVSRTPVREALGRLGHQGILESREGGGYWVPNVTEQDIEDFIEVRKLVEPYAAKRAIDHRSDEQIGGLYKILKDQQSVIPNSDPSELLFLTNDFWKALWVMSGNQGLARCLANLLDQYHFQYIALQALRDEGVRNTVLRLETAVLDAVKAADSRAAVDAVKKHLKFKRTVLLEAINQARAETEKNVTTIGDRS